MTVMGSNNGSCREAAHQDTGWYPGGLDKANYILLMIAVARALVLTSVAPSV